MMFMRLSGNAVEFSAFLRTKVCNSITFKKNIVNLSIHPKISCHLHLLIPVHSFIACMGTLCRFVCLDEVFLLTTS